MTNEDYEVFEYQKNAMIKNAKLAVLECEFAHSRVFSDGRKTPEEARNNIILGLHYLSVVKSIYYSSPDYEHSDIEDFFNCFEVFTREILSNIAKDHSHQWTDIEYRNMLNAYINSVIADPDYSDEVAAKLQ